MAAQGTGTISDLVAGLDWVASNAKPPAVATLSLGVPVGQVRHCHSILLPTSNQLLKGMYCIIILVPLAALC